MTKQVLWKILKKSYSMARYTKYLYMYMEYHSVCPRVGIGIPQTPSECVPIPAEPKLRGGGKAHSPEGEGVGSPNSNDWRKSVALCLLCCRICQYWIWFFISLPALLNVSWDCKQMVLVPKTYLYNETNEMVGCALSANHFFSWFLILRRGMASFPRNSALWFWKQVPGLIPIIRVQ